MRDREQQRRLPAAGLADHADELTGVYVEIDVIDRDHGTGAGVVLDREIPDLKKWLIVHVASEPAAERDC
ncbi:hypothetical protein GCM10010522_47190 [Kribbella solani]